MNKHSEIMYQTLMNRTNYFMTCQLKPFVASQLNLKSLQDFYLSYMEIKFRVTRVANTDTQSKPFMACFGENGNTYLR